MKYFFLLALVLFAFASQSINLEEYQEQLARLEASVEATTDDIEAANAVTFFNREFLRDSDDVTSDFVQKGLEGETSCSCCANCNNADFNAPCTYYKPKLHCLRPLGHSDALWSAVSKKKVDVWNNEPEAAACGWWLVPIIEPIGYVAVGFFGALERVLVGAQGVTNCCARAFPLWTHTGSVRQRPPTKAEIIARIDHERRKIAQLQIIEAQPIRIDAAGALPPKY